MLANPKAYVSGSATDPPDPTKQHTEIPHSYHKHESDEKESEYESINYLSAQSPVLIDNGPNNLVYSVMNVGFGKEFVSGASAYPPELKFNEPITAFKSNEDANINIITDILSQVTIESELIGDTESCFNNSVTVPICNITSKCEIELTKEASIHETYKSINNINDSNTEEIHSKLIKWWIRVPIRLKDDTIIYIKMLADTGANAGCIDTKFALKHFSDYIVHNRKNSVLNTPGGPVHPKYCVYLTFPTKSGIILKAKLYLINNLPVSIIADLNMLIAFGYEFNDQIPNKFIHEEEPQLDLQLKDQDSLYRIHHTYQVDKRGKPKEVDYVGAKDREPNFNDYKDFKDSQLNYDNIDQIVDNNEVLYVSNRSQINKDDDSKDSDPRLINEAVINQLSDETLKRVSDMNFKTFEEYMNDESIMSIIDCDEQCINMSEMYLQDVTKYKHYSGKTNQQIVNYCDQTERENHQILHNVQNSMHNQASDPRTTILESPAQRVDPNYIGPTQDTNMIPNENDEDNMDEDIDILNATETVKNSARTKNSIIGQSARFNYDKFARLSIKTRTNRITRLSNTSFNLAQQTRIRHINFIMARESYLATADEIKAASKLDHNKELKFNDFTYLLSYPKRFGLRFTGLYAALMELIRRYREIFAKHTYDRRTMLVPPVRLGILPQHRHKTCYTPQYPLTALQRLWMIVYTQENEKNGYWVKVNSAIHNLPNTMVGKKVRNIITRYRPAFDARKPNQYCELFPNNMPTLRYIDEMYAIPGLFTLADMKNMYDCIPLDIRDQPWCVVTTPLGLYQMKHLSYGWKNAPAVAQAIMNRMAISVGYMIVYIDDILMKHPWKWTVKQLIAHMEKFFKYCKEKRMLLNPTKFFPFVTECTSFSIKRTLEGSTIGDKYKEKILTFAKPKTVRELKELIGIVTYIIRYLYRGSSLTYWLNSLTANLNDRGTLQWTREASTAFEQILYLVEHAPLLHNPTPDGMFCIKTDACNYGGGAVLYQMQYDKKIDQNRWVIIDMHSRTMPKEMRKCHSMVHEAWALTTACQHWQFYLLKRKFLITTDNKPVASLYTEKYRELKEITQKQLLRMRIAIAQFTFEMRHVEGVKNELADGLSRFTCDLVDKNPGKYKDAINAIIMTDTEQKTISDDEIKSLMDDLYKDPTTNQKFIDAINGGSINFINQFMNSRMSDNTKRNEIFYLLNKNYNATLQHFRKTAAWHEKARLGDFLNSATNENVLTSDEYCYNSTPFVNLLDNIKSITDDIDCLSETAIDTLIARSREAIDSDNNYQINQICEKLDILQNEHGMQTRSKTSKEKAKYHKRAEFIHPHYDNTVKRMYIRSEFMTELYGYRHNNKSFNNDTILTEQKNDIQIQLVREILVTMDELHIGLRDQHLTKTVAKLTEENPNYVVDLQGDNMRINPHTQLIEARHWSPLDQSDVWVIVVPIILRGKFMDFAHHNVNSHHFHWQQTLDNLEGNYTWPYMKRDIKRFCEKCLLCDFLKGTTRHRAPMQIRELMAPRTHVMFDFIGSILQRYYIMAIIDYCTGWTLLIPCYNTGIQTVVDCIISQWIPLHGQFRYLECDYGSSFSSAVWRALMQAQGVNMQFAEPKNHRSIGKVERVIGFVRSILRRYNIQLDGALNDNVNHKRSWKTIKVLLPHIQAAINQHRPRFTTYSPNMLIFGKQLSDLSNIQHIITRLNEQYNKEASHTGSVTQDYNYIFNLLNKLTKIYTQFKDDWIKYVHLSREGYNRRYHITPKSMARNRTVYVEGQKILYYIGDQKMKDDKWHRKWSGPWTIKLVLNDSTIIISDPETNNQKRVSIDRCKLFKAGEMDPYTSKMAQESTYQRYRADLENLFFKYNVKTEDQTHNLDYRTNLE